MHTARPHTLSAHKLRLDRLRQRLAGAGCDALLVTQLPNVFYLSGFTGTAASLLVTPAEQHFITDFRYHGRLGAEVSGDWRLADSTQRRPADVLAQLLPPRARLGVEAEHMPLAQYGGLEAAGQWQLVQTNRLVEELRMVKDGAELDALRRAAAAGAQVFTQLLPLLTARTSEADVAAEIEYRARRLGASATSFKPIVASGPRSALPHAGFTAAPLQPAAPLVLDLGVVVDGYCSDMTRTVFLGDCPPQWRTLYELVDRARATAQAALRPGLSGRDADKAAREVIAAAGYSAQFGHGLGHGVGIQIHEDPRLHDGYAAELAAGHVVTCEPGIYLPGQGGIRIENLCAITADGAENLTPLDTQLTVV